LVNHLDTTVYVMKWRSNIWPMSPYFITDPPTHSVGGRLVTMAGICNTHICNVTHHRQHAVGQ